MSLLDTIMSAAEQHSEVNQQQHSSLVQTALEMFGNRAGLSSLLGNAESGGMGAIVQSWIGNGQNQPINAQQVQNLVGEDRINQIAARTGIPPGIASAALSRILPAVVDKVTPNGTMPRAA